MRTMQWGMNKRSLGTGVALLAMVLGGTTMARAGWDNNKVKGEFTRNYTVSGQVDLDVRSGCGDVEVRSGSGNTVAIMAHIEINSRYGGNAEQRVQAIEANPPIQQTGNIIRITHEPSSEWRNICVNYVITSPKTTHMMARTGSGNVVAEGISGPVDAESGSGDVRIASIGSMTRVHTGSGNISAERIQGEVHMETGSGDVQAVDIAGGFTGHTGSGNIKLRQNAPGPVRAETGSGDIEVTGSNGSLHATTGSGNIHADGDPKGPWHLSTGSGEVSLRLPSNASVDVSARTSSGSVSVDHPITVQGKVGRQEIHGKMGNGGPLMEVSTGSGDISIK